ncbi:hypothetical protein ADUPG1_010160, partial [Aduncisulcus paluster]
MDEIKAKKNPFGASKSSRLSNLIDEHPNSYWQSNCEGELLTISPHSPIYLTEISLYTKKAQSGQPYSIIVWFTTPTGSTYCINGNIKKATGWTRINCLECLGKKQISQIEIEIKNTQSLSKSFFTLHNLSLFVDMVSQGRLIMEKKKEEEEKKKKEEEEKRKEEEEPKKKQIRHDEFLEFISSYIIPFQQKITDLEAVIDSLQYQIDTQEQKLADQQREIVSHRQLAKTEQLALIRKISSLQIELSCVSSRASGSVVEISDPLKLLYDNLVIQRKAMRTNVKKFVDLKDETNCTSSALISKISPYLWCQSSESSDKDCSTFLQFISFLRFLCSPRYIDTPCDTFESSSTTIPITGISQCFDILSSDLSSVLADPSISYLKSLGFTGPNILSPYFVVSECASQISNVPCLVTLDSRINYLESLAAKVCSFKFLDPTNIYYIVKNGQKCITQLTLFLSCAVGVTINGEADSDCKDEYVSEDLECESNCKNELSRASIDASKLLSVCDHVSPQVAKCLQHFASRAKRFTDQANLYATSSKNSCIPFADLVKNGDISDDQPVGWRTKLLSTCNDLWNSVLTELGGSMSNSRKCSSTSMDFSTHQQCDFAEKDSSKSSDIDKLAISSFLSVLPLCSERIHLSKKSSIEIDPTSKPIRSPSSPISSSASLRHGTTSSTLNNTMITMCSLSVGELPSNYFKSVDNLSQCIHELGENLCSHIDSCLSQAHMTDAKLHSLRSRLEGNEFD